MRRELFSALTYTSRNEVEKVADWAAIICPVPGGWMAFASVADYNTWRGAPWK